MNQGPRRTGRQRAGAMLTGVAACGLLLFNTASRKGSTDYADLDAYRRLWGDLAVAISSHLDAQSSRPALERALVVPASDGVVLSEAAIVFRRILIDRIAKEEVRPVQFWRTVKLQPFLRERIRVGAPPFEDPGRAWLLAAGFRLLGGISPFLILWLGALLACPILLWSAWELSETGQPLAAAVYCLLVPSSPFVVEVLALPRYAVAFYLLGALLLVPFAIWSGARRPTFRGLVVRTAMGGVGLALCALSRSSSLFLLGGFVMALGLAANRLRAGLTSASGPRRGLAFVLGLALLVGPFMALRPGQHHDVWMALWEGLGDFDRTHGHVWSDPVAEKVVTDRGGDGLKTPRSEVIFRQLVLVHVREDPGWYLGILAQRLFATLTQRRLWPWAPLDGLSIASSSSLNEGVMDKYYRYTYTVDYLGVGSRQWEVPISLLALPTGLYALLAWRRRRCGDEPPSLSGLLALACLAAGTLPLPVFFSTVGGQETQTFALLWFLGVALCIEELPRAVRPVRQR